MGNNRRKKRKKEEYKRHKITADKGTTTDQINRKTRADKSAFIENLADEAETAAQMHNMATVYKVTKALAGSFKNSDITMKDADW